LKERKDGSYELINQMLATMPEGRLSAKEVLQHEFFSFDHNEAMITQQPPIYKQDPSSIEHIREVN
jgi:serine/threonine protein kinase